MSKQLVTFSFLCSFVLFLVPGPAHGNFNSGDCTIGDSPDGDLVTSVTPTCSNDSAAVEVVARSDDDISSGDIQHRVLFIRIDYICIGEDGQQTSINATLQMDVVNTVVLTPLGASSAAV